MEHTNDNVLTHSVMQIYFYQKANETALAIDREQNNINKNIFDWGWWLVTRAKVRFESQTSSFTIWRHMLMPFIGNICQHRIEVRAFSSTETRSAHTYASYNFIFMLMLDILLQKHANYFKFRTFISFSTPIWNVSTDCCRHKQLQLITRSSPHIKRLIKTFFLTKINQKIRVNVRISLSSILKTFAITTI